jgi:hypothetical protein
LQNALRAIVTTVGAARRNSGQAEAIEQAEAEVRVEGYWRRKSPLREYAVIICLGLVPITVCVSLVAKIRERSAHEQMNQPLVTRPVADPDE